MILVIIPVLLVSVLFIAIFNIYRDSKRMDEAVARHIAELSKILENGGNR